MSLLRNSPSSSSLVSVDSLFRRAIKNAVKMSILWAGLGMVVGCLTLPVNGNGTLLTANILAGIIVLTPLGALLGFFGAGRREVLICALGGAMLSYVGASAVAHADLAKAAAIGLVFGGAVGATFVTTFFRLPSFIASYFSARV